MKKFLSLKGGGIRGIVQAYALEKLEESTGKQIFELFDFIGGTSTGGILATLLANGKHTAREAGELYSKHGKEIFSRDPWQRVRSVEGLRDEKYSNKSLLMYLKKYFGEIRTMGKAKIPVMVTTSDTVTRQPVFLKSWKHPGVNTLMWYACQQTSAAPTFFEAAMHPYLSPGGYMDPGEISGRLDGGVFANNPVREIQAEGLRLFGVDEPYLLVSMGNGLHTRSIYYKDCKDFGGIQWLPKYINISMNEPNIAATIDARIIAEVYGNTFYEFDGQLKIANDDMDDASERNKIALQKEAKLIYDTIEFEEMSALLVQGGFGT